MHQVSTEIRLLGNAPLDSRGSMSCATMTPLLFNSLSNIRAWYFPLLITKVKRFREKSESVSQSERALHTGPVSTASPSLPRKSLTYAGDTCNALTCSTQLLAGIDRTNVPWKFFELKSQYPTESDVHNLLSGSSRRDAHS